ncbi:MAG: response regulator transcription factor [Flavobacteriales bacterium]|nr:response regulator transcription factor [Flavobacteriales bacterium]
MKKFRVVIVDDEYLLADLIENYLSKFDDFEVVGKFNDSLVALAYLNSHDVDLAFLDIEMPTMNGIDLGKLIVKNTRIVFTTAYSEYAVNGFDLNALDYLMKPISFVRFSEAIARFVSQQKSSSSTSDRMKSMIVKSNGDLHQIELSELFYIQSLREYLRFFLKDNKLIVYGSLSKLEEEISSHGFLRVHKSYIISKEHISKISGNQVYMSNGDIIPIGRTYKDLLLAQVK